VEAFCGSRKEDDLILSEEIEGPLKWAFQSSSTLGQSSDLAMLPGV
jgi:hypothetical protein